MAVTMSRVSVQPETIAVAEPPIHQGDFGIEFTDGSQPCASIIKGHHLMPGFRTESSQQLEHGRMILNNNYISHTQSIDRIDLDKQS
jgi:hypothetical protein